MPLNPSITEIIESLTEMRGDVEKTHAALGKHIKKLGTIAHDDGHHELLALLMRLQRVAHDMLLVLKQTPAPTR